MILGQEHIPQTQLLGLLLQLLHDSRSSLPSLLALAQLGGEDRVGGDTVFLDEFLDLCRYTEMVSIVLDGVWMSTGSLMPRWDGRSGGNVPGRGSFSPAR